MKRFYFLLTIISIALLPLIGLGQTGPAGVGNAGGTAGQPENFLWLDAATIGIADGVDVTTWADISGNGTVFSASASGNLPDYELNVVNGRPVVDFDDTNAERLAVNPYNNMASDEITTIIVFATANDGEGVLSYNAAGRDNEYLIFNPGNIATYVTGNNNAGGDFSDGATSFNILTSVWDSNGGSLEHFKNSSSVNTGTIANGNSITNGGAFVIGGEQDAVDGGYDANQDFGGKIAEIIAFKKSLNEAERLIIENYLSEKYAITIGNDLFSLRDGAFINDVRGIGTANGSDKYAESGFSDALKIDEANNSLNATNEYLLFAHDNTTHAENITTQLDDPTKIDDRWARSWFVENSGTVSAELVFDFGNAGITIGSSTDYVLLYRPDLASDFTRLSVNSYSVQNTDQLVVDAGNTNLNTGYYTIGRGEQLIPGNIYSFETGDWNDPLTWTTDPSGALRTPTSGIVPTSEDNVTILAGDVVTMDSDDNDGLNLTVEEKLIIGNTSGHDFTNIAGGGTISIAGDASGDDNFPSGSTGLFADSIVGGTVEISGTAINLNQARTYNNLVLNLDNASDVATLTANYTLFGDLTLQNGEFSINDNASTTNLEISTYGDVLVESGASFTTGSANARHEFNFYGDLTVSGSLAFTNRGAPVYGTEANNGIVDANFINDTKNQSIDCNGVSNFYRIEIDKGNDQTYILDISASSAANFNLFGPADYNHGSQAQLTTNDNALGLLRGTVRLNNNVDVPVLNNGGNYNISEAARLWVNGGSATKPNGTAIVPYGTIQLSDGTIDAPINSGITTRVNGNIVVSGGIMTVNQIRTSVNGPENIGGYTQSGGTVNVTGDSYNNNYYVFSLTYPGNTFNMSAGTLHVSGANEGSNTGGVFIASDPGNQSVTGGEVIMDISENDNFKLTSKAPFWDVIMRKSGGSGTEIELITGASGNAGNVTNITDPDLKVLNNLTIETGVIFDHNGNDVEIGSDFTIQNGADYVYDAGKPNTTSFNGTDNGVVSFLNRTGGPNDEQRFWNVIVDRPSGKEITLQSGKADLTANENNLFRIEGDFFKVLSGTVNQGEHSIRMYADTLVNYDELTVFDPDLFDVSNEFYENDILKLRDDGGSTIFITADTSRFGAIKLNSGSEIIELVSDLKIDYLLYKHGRMNLDVHNLTIDVLAVDLAGGETRTDEDGGGNFSVEDMFITAGNASDGGLSLKVNADGTNPGYIAMQGAANTTNNPTVFFFPLGTGTTGVDATSEFTPTNIRLLSATDEGYMTVIPVTKKLAKAGPYPLGNNVSDRYWIVDYKDFSTVPKVERIWFRSVEKDDPNGGTAGFPNNFGPGYVLEDDPFTRTSEVKDEAPGSSGIDFTDATNIRIFFWGNEGPAPGSNPAGGFDLIHAAYTAGDASKFVGAPEIYYSRNDGNWDANNTWSTDAVNQHEGGGASDYPKEGDIVFIAGNPSDASHSIIIREDGGAPNDIEVVQVTFRGGASPSLVIQTNGSLNSVDLGNVKGETGTSSTIVREIDNTTYTLTADLAQWSSIVTNEFQYKVHDNGSGNAATIPTDLNDFPILTISGNRSGDKNGAPQYFATLGHSITVRGDLQFRSLVDFSFEDGATETVTVLGDVNIGSNNDARVTFPETGYWTLDIAGDLGLLVNTNAAWGEQAELLVDQDAAVDHRIRLGGDIVVEQLDDGGADGQDPIIDLYANTGGGGVILELTGLNDAVTNITNTGGGTLLVPDLYKVVMNKETSNASFSFNHNANFLLPSNISAQPIEIVNGLLVVNDPNIDVTLTDAARGNFLLPNTANPEASSGSGGLEIAQGTVRVDGDNAGLILDGSLRISGGTLDMDDSGGNGNNFIEYSASGNALLEISSGTLNVGSQIRGITSAPTGVLKYRQTGGDVRIGTQAGPQNDRGMFQIYNVGSEFTYTGGTLAIERHQTTPSVAALFLDPDIEDVTATIDVFNGNTPAGQSDFRINSFIPLAGLNINGTNNPTAIIDTNPLEIDGDLFVENGATFNGNGITLAINGDYENNGSFDAQGNETIFSSEITQDLLGTGTNNFFRFTKTGAGSLNLNNDIEINDLFTISDGNLNDGGNDITLRADAVIDGEHSSSGGNGLVFAGAANQELRSSTSGTGTLGVVSINNSNGVTIPDGNGYNFNINGGLRLDGGVFEVGGSNILFGQSANIVAVQPFSVSNMIRTNSSFADKGVGKTFAAGTTTDFTFPLGQTYYTPVILSGGTSGSSNGSIFVSPANEYHPTVDDGDDTFGSDINNVLQYYWTLTAEGINGFSSNVTFGYNDALVKAEEGGFTEADYIAARILAFDNPTEEINKFGVGDVDETNNLISFSVAGGSNAITGDYFAGIDQAIPDNVVTYIVQNSTTGDIKFSSTYTTALPEDGTPPSGAVIEIPAGSTLQLPDDNIRLYKTIINDGATLEVMNSTNHRLGILEGTGNLKITSDGANATLPAFSGNFLSCSGGGLEYAGTGSYSVLDASFLSVIRNLTLSGSGNRNFPNKDITICEDLIVDGPTVNPVNGNRIFIERDLIINSGFLTNPGSNSGRLTVLGQTNINGGSFVGNSAGRTFFAGSVTIDGGTFTVGSSNNLLFFYENIIFNSGNFNGGTGSSEVIIYANAAYNSNAEITGNFNGLNSFRNLRIDKNSLGNDIFLNGSIEVENRLFLDDGLIIANENEVRLGASATVSPAKGRSNSYITGKVTKPLNSVGDDFTFPIGSANIWRPATIQNVSTGGLTWEAQFFQANVVDNTIVASMDPADANIETLQQGEYWVISDGNGAPSGVTAEVGLSWGIETDVAANSADRDQLRVMVWNDGNQNWDNLGGTGISGSQSEGAIASSSTVGFSENIFVMGSTDIANPLPVELTFFTAKNNGNRVELNWQTASENNNDFFEVQRSFDGKEFEVLGIVEGGGDSKETINYGFKDYAPLAGHSYYRLRQVDYDGVFDYSEVVMINRVEESDLVAVPNPTQAQNIKLRLSGFHAEQKIQVAIFDMQGRRHYQAIHDPSDFAQPLPINQELNSGIYIVDVKQGNIRKKVRLMVR